MNQQPDKVIARRQTIVEVWTSMGRLPVGEQTLRRIRRALADKFGAGVVPSPAAIARVLADEGADLLHPEVIECDARWREKNLRNASSDLMTDRDLAEPLTLTRAAGVIRRLEQQRERFMRDNEQNEARGLRELAQIEKARAQLLTRDDTLDAGTRAAQREISEWFRVWLLTPDIFEDWLDLRRRSDDFRKQFPNG
jgi:hypothetical protein